jgi:Tol biopolymer transport system component
MFNTSEPVFSPDGHEIAYVAKDAFSEISQPNSWTIYVVKNGTDQFITNGYNPLFSLDGTSILYPRNDGIYVFDIASSTAEKVWAVTGGEAGTGIKLAHSHDGQVLLAADTAHSALAP